MMAFSLTAMAQEHAALDALVQVGQYRLVDAELQLLEASGHVILAFCELVSPTLTANLWKLLAYNHGRGGVTSVLSGTRITASFEDAGFLAGLAGCNHYRTNYHQADEALSIGPVVTSQSRFS
ncbi:MAG: META domain-containing protein [Leptolyngbyaceae cyanobacterium SM2_5_2]|nr:META domain-containing protein [Leptolyngbyaceae cyanobacterium SM2_5_2]